MFKISLDSLLVLDAVDRLGTFAAAADELFRVPSTISYTVSKLEQDLDVKIYERMGPKVKLTLAGKELLTEGRYLLRAADELESRVRRVAKGWEAELKIGIDTLFSPAALTTEIADFFEIAPQTRLRFLHDSVSGTWEALLDGRVDLLIGAVGPGPSGGGYKTHLLGEIEYVFVVSPNHPLADSDKPIGRQDLAQHRVITVSDSVRHMQARTAGLFDGQNTLAVPNMTVKLDLQIAGLGVGYVPKPMACVAIDNNQLIVKEVAETRHNDQLFIAWRTGESGLGLKWWIDNLDTPTLFDKLWR
jgi:DNA-binding transcriptional LysR family regulator